MDMFGHDDFYLAPVPLIAYRVRTESEAPLAGQTSYLYKEKISHELSSCYVNTMRKKVKAEPHLNLCARTVTLS
jgi:hypothetical protein